MFTSVCALIASWTFRASDRSHSLTSDMQLTHLLEHALVVVLSLNRFLALFDRVLVRHQKQSDL